MGIAKIKSTRRAPRKAIGPLLVSSVSLMDNLSKLARGGEIVDASITGFLMIIKREDLIPKEFRHNLSMDKLVGSSILIYFPQMNIEMAGTVKRTRLLGKKGFEIGIDFTDDAPQYWRECLLDLLPLPGELDK